MGKRSGGGLQRGPGYQSGYTHTVCISCHNFYIIFIYILKETEAACRSGITTIYSGVQRGKATEARGKRSAEGESKIRDQRIPTRVFKYLRQNRGGSLQKLINLLIYEYNKPCLMSSNVEICFNYSYVYGTITNKFE